MSFMKMASMASAAIALVLVVVMLDSAMPETFIRVVVMGLLMAITAFLAYRLMLAFNMVQELGQTKSVPKETMYGIYALAIVTFICGVSALYLLLNPFWDVGILSAGGLAVLLVFIVSRSMLQIDMLPLLGIDDDANNRTNHNQDV